MAGRPVALAIVTASLIVASPATAQDNVCSVERLSANRPVVQAAAKELGRCLQDRRGNPQLECQAGDLDFSWLTACVREQAESLTSREAGYREMSIPERIDFALERTEFQAAKADIDLFAALRVALSAQNIGGIVSNR